MLKARQIGCYNVTINEGQLDHKTNKWFYIMQVDKFNIGDNWEGSKHYYIKGHTNGNPKEESFYSSMVDVWLHSMNVRDIERIFLAYPKNHKFKISKPELVIA